MNLEYLKKGERITADHYHEVTRAARAQFMLGGSSDADGSITRPLSKMPEVIQVYSEIAIPKNSVFQIDVASQTDDITVFNVKKSIDDDIEKVWCTNPVKDIVANSFAYATIIATNVPIKVKSDSADYPEVLQQCGAIPDSFEVSASGEGLICLSIPDANDMVEVVAIGGGGASLKPYKITSEAYGGVADAFYQSSHPDGFTVKKVSWTGSNWSEEGDDLTMFGSFMHGVAFTDAVIFGTKIKGRLEAVSGDCGHVFRDGIIVTADTATTGTVALQASGAPVVPYTLPGWMAELFVVDDPVSVGFDQQSQMFWIIQRGCGTV